MINPALSQFGTTMSRLTGVRAIMADIIATLKEGQDQEFLNFSSGNPLVLTEVEKLWKDCTKKLLASRMFAEFSTNAMRGFPQRMAAIAAKYS